MGRKMIRTKRGKDGQGTKVMVMVVVVVVVVRALLLGTHKRFLSLLYFSVAVSSVSIDGRKVNTAPKCVRVT